MKKEKYSITGMTCAACQSNITKRVQKIDGVKGVNVSLLSNQMVVTYDDALVDTAQIVASVNSIGYGAASLQETMKESNGFRSDWQARKQLTDDAQKGMQRRLSTSLILIVPLMYIAMGHMLSLPLPRFFIGTQNAMISAFSQLLITLPIVVVNRNFYQSGFKALRKRAPNMDSLVAIGSSASLLYGIFAIYLMAFGFGHNDLALVQQYTHELYFESCAMILTLVTVGKYLEARSKSKTSDALEKLVQLAPKTAVVIRDGKEETILSEQVVMDDIVVIKPGESIPVDGVVTEGYGFVDQSAITGESIPVEKKIGDTVISATLNKNGAFRFRAAKVGNDTTLAQIIRLVDEAGNSKAPIARLADRISGIFVPIVIFIAMVTAAIWLLVGQSFEFALSCAIAVLVISCPCALGLATPVAIMVGTGKAAEYGILIKSAGSLEILHEADTVVLDKTGTITTGHPAVTDIVVLDEDLSEKDFLSEAATVEAGSEHPLAIAILETAMNRKIEIKQTSYFHIEAGRGVTAMIGSGHYFAGNEAFLRENKILSDDECSITALKLSEKFSFEGKTPLLFGKNGKLSGIIAVADTIRETSRMAVTSLRNMGIHIVMLTGDNHITAKAIKDELNIDEVVAEVLPDEKEASVRALQEKGHKVIMVGDGINDAPALIRANIGIAIGAGTDVAIESADVVLMKDSLNDVVTSIDLSKAVIRNIRMNLFWAFFYNVLGIPIAAGILYPSLGLHLSPMIGAAAMSLSSICVVTNALRLRFFKEKRNFPDTPAMPEQSQFCKNKKSLDRKGEKNMKKIITVEGMMCAHCQMHIEKALAAVDGVESVTVDLKNKKATAILSKNVDEKILFDTVREAGYTPVDCVSKDD